MMFGKIQYYVRRVLQAPPSITILKMLEVLKKKTYRIVYWQNTVWPGVPANRTIEICGQYLQALGDDIHAATRAHQAAAPGVRDTCLDRAASVLASRFQCLGYGEVEIGPETTWNSDPLHEFEWPASYFDKIDFVAIGSPCDIKVPWEISRFQYLLWLAEGFVLDPENAATYRQKFVELLDNWFSANPAGYGVNWIVPMEVAIRAVNLLLASAVFWKDLSQDHRTRIVKALDEHRQHIERFPEFSDVPGNHYLSNLMGLAVLAPCLFGSTSEETAATFAKFYAEAERQFEPEGGHFERAPVYHRLCMDMVTIVIVFEARISKVSGSGIRILGRALAFCTAVSSLSGRLPVLGDCDSGHILWFGGCARDWRWTQHFFFSTENPGVLEDGSKRQLLWHRAIARRSGLNAPQVDTKGAGADSVRTAEASGYIAIHDGTIDCVMRVGKQGLKGRASHDHDDALSVWISHLGDDLVVEKGCHSYTLDRNIRAGYIVSRAHNLVQPLGRDRFAPRQGSIVNTVVGAPTAERWDLDETVDRLTMSAALDTGTSTDVVFRTYVREIIREPGVLVVEDTWQWRDVQSSELRWHFAPSFDVSIIDGENRARVSDRSGNFVCTVSIRAANLETIELFDFEFSEVYGHSDDATGLRFVFGTASENLAVTRFDFADATQRYLAPLVH